MIQVKTQPKIETWPVLDPIQQALDNWPAELACTRTWEDGAAQADGDCALGFLLDQGVTFGYKHQTAIARENDRYGETHTPRELAAHMREYVQNLRALGG